MSIKYTFAYMHSTRIAWTKSGLQFSVGFKLSAAEAAPATIAAADNHVTQPFHFISNSTSAARTRCNHLKVVH